MELVNYDTIQKIILNSEKLYPERTAMQFVRNGTEYYVSFKRFCADIRYAAEYFRNKELYKNNIVIAAAFDYEWLIIMYGILMSGNCCVPINCSESAEVISEKCSAVDTAAIVCSSSIRKKLHQAQLFGHENIIDITEVYEYDNNTEHPVYDDFPEIVSDDTALIIFTSGTTSAAKPVILTHGNITSNLKGCYIVSDGSINAKQIEVNMTVLPPYHSYQITIGFLYQFAYGGVICISKDVKAFSRDICYFKPTGIVVVPLIVELMYNKIMLEIKRKGKLKKFESGRKLSNTLMKCHIDIRRKIFSDILDGLGGNLHLIHCGGADLKKEYVRFFFDIGIDIFVGYGITECSPLISVNRIKERRDGSVGKVMQEPYMRLKIENNEIMVKGESVFKGYYNSHLLTHEAFKDGWFCTGDLGYFDSDGFLYITGRKKNLIILSNGENVSPEELENELLKIDEIKECLVYEKQVNSVSLIAVKIFADFQYQNSRNIQLYYNDIKDKIKIQMQKWPSFKQIKYIEFVEDEFKKNALGKVIR